MTAQIAKHKLNSVISSHRYGVEVHQPACCVFVVRENRFYTLAILLVHRLQDFSCELLRQLLQDINKVIVFKSLR